MERARIRQSDEEQKAVPQDDQINTEHIYIATFLDFLDEGMKITKRL